MWLRLLDSFPFFLLYALLLVGLVVIGFAIAKKLYVERNKQWKPSGVESSLIGFFALVLSFTLSASYSAAHDRTSHIHQQADAIAQLHRESLLTNDGLKKQVAEYLVSHIDAQLSFYKNPGEDVDELTQAITRQNEAFYAAVVNDSGKRIAFQPLSPAYNALSSATFRMLYSYTERTPGIILFLLLLTSLLAGLLVGFMNGFYERPHILVPLLYVLLVSFTMKALLDLDNPLKGNVRPEYKNLQDLRAIVSRS